MRLLTTLRLYENLLIRFIAKELFIRLRWVHNQYISQVLRLSLSNSFSGQSRRIHLQSGCKYNAVFGLIVLWEEIQILQFAKDNAAYNCEKYLKYVKFSDKALLLTMFATF